MKYPVTLSKLERFQKGCVAHQLQAVKDVVVFLSQLVTPSVYMDVRRET
jgi:hypothetical protein